MSEKWILRIACVLGILGGIGIQHGLSLKNTVSSDEKLEGLDSYDDKSRGVTCYRIRYGHTLSCVKTK